jgi:hypothetical protein
MATLTLDVDKELLDLLVPAVEAQLQQAEHSRDLAQDAVDALKAKLERVKAKVAAASSVNPARAPSGRMKKGESERLIINFMHGRNGTGVTVKDVMEGTGTTYGTARRILREFVAGGKLTEQDNIFKWSKTRTPEMPDEEEIPF